MHQPNAPALKSSPPSLEYNSEEENGIPVLEINSDAGESYLKPISHHQKNTALPKETLAFEFEEESGIQILEIGDETAIENTVMPEKERNLEYLSEEAILKPLEMNIHPTENIEEGLVIQKTGEMVIPPHAHKPDENLMGGLEPALEILFEEDPDGDDYSNPFTANNGSPTPNNTPPKPPQQNTPEANQKSGRKESIPSKVLTRGTLEISQPTPQKKKNELPITNTRYIDIPRPKIRAARVVLSEQKEQLQEESAPIEEIMLPILKDAPKLETLPDSSIEIPIAPVEIQIKEPIAEESPLSVDNTITEKESAIETPLLPLEEVLPESIIEIPIAPVEIQTTEPVVEEPLLSMDTTIAEQEPEALPDLSVEIPKVPTAPIKNQTLKRSVPVRPFVVPRPKLSAPITPKMEEKAAAAQTFIQNKTPQTLPFQEPSGKKMETEIKLAPPVTPLAKNRGEEDETENIFKGNDARKLDYFPISIHCLLQIFTVGIFPYLWFADRWKTFNQFSYDEKINARTTHFYIIFGAIAQLIAAVAIIFSLFIPEATLLSLSEKLPTGLGAWIVGFFAPKTLWMLYGFILCVAVLPLRTLIYFSVRWNIRMMANEWDPEERMAPRTVGSWLGLFVGGTAYLQHHINRLIALGMLVTDYEDDEWDAFQDPISFMRSLSSDSDDTEDPLPARVR